MKSTFVRLVDPEKPEAGGVWRDETGLERVLAAPKRFRPKCVHASLGGMNCPRTARPDSPYCAKHQTEASRAPAYLPSRGHAE